MYGGLSASREGWLGFIPPSIHCGSMGNPSASFRTLRQKHGQLRFPHHVSLTKFELDTTNDGKNKAGV